MMINLKKHIHTLLIIGILGIMACASEAPAPAKTIAKAKNTSKEMTQSAVTVAKSMNSEVKGIVVDSIQNVVQQTKAAPAAPATPTKPVVKKQPTKAAIPAKKATQKPIPPKRIKPKATGSPKISWEKTIHDFGMIKEGDVIETSFKFTNTGNAPLVVKNASASCGCTQPSYPFIPIEPGEDGYIGVVYNSRTKIGPQKPYITITSNAAEPIQKVYLKGYVEQVDTEQTTGKNKAQVIEAVPIKEGNN